MDGMPGIGESRGGGQIEPGESFTYEFDAAPFGLHLYHCHVAPLAAHIARGLYGAFVIDPKQGRPEADEMVMVMNGFDTNFDLANEVYAVNTVGFHYVNEPIQVKRDELVRIYLVNVLEYDPLNSFHVHGNFFQLLPDRDLAGAERVHRHGDPGAGAARDPRAEVPLRRRLHVPRPRQRVRRARLDRVLPRRRPLAADRRRRRGRLLQAALGREREAGLMEAGARAERGSAAACRPGRWALIPLALIAVAIGAFALLGGPGLGERTGPPVEEVAVERTVLRPGEIELTLRNDGPDPVEVAQVAVNDAYAPVRRHGRRRDRPARLDHARRSPTPGSKARPTRSSSSPPPAARSTPTIPVAAETPEADLDFYGLMALLGIYVGVIPVSLGMLWLPFLRPPRRGAGSAPLIAFTVGLLAFLAIDAGLEGLEIAAEAPTAFGGASLVFVGGLGRLPAAGRGRRPPLAARRARRGPAAAAAAPTWRCWSRSGSACTTSARAWRSAPPTRPARSPWAPSWSSASRSTTPPRGWRSSRRCAAVRRAGATPGSARLLGLGLIAGAPAILGAWIGAAAFNPSLAALLFGVGVGAIVRVIVQIAPSMRDEDGRLLYPVSVAGMLAGIAVLYVTGLLVTV